MNLYYTHHAARAGFERNRLFASTIQTPLPAWLPRYGITSCFPVKQHQ